MSDRQALRRHFRAQRRALSKQVQSQHALAVAQTLSASVELHHAQCIGLYLANDGEVDLAPLIAELAGANKQLALPVVAEHRDMDFYRYHPGDALAPNRFHILEPITGAKAGTVAGAHLVDASTLDLLLIPVVAFDNAGNRLGMGAGYYDRYLAKLSGESRPRTIGIAHELQRSATLLPTQSWDIPVDRIVTEAGWQVGD